jgi:serine/threonine protein kinase
MAPEQVKAKVRNEKTDIYNLGATMYRMVTLRLPPSYLESGVRLDSKTLQKMLQPVQELNAGAPPLLCELIHSCLAYQPEKRPARMSEAQGTLHHIAERLIQDGADRLEMYEWK